MRRRARRHERLTLAPREPEPVRVPGIELPQIAAGALDAEVILGRGDDPFQLGDHLVRLGLALIGAEQAAEHPWVAERAAREHDRGGSALLEAAERLRISGEA